MYIVTHMKSLIDSAGTRPYGRKEKYIFFETIRSNIKLKIL